MNTDLIAIHTNCVCRSVCSAEHVPDKAFAEIIINSNHLVTCWTAISQTAQQKTPADGIELPFEMGEH